MEILTLNKNYYFTDPLHLNKQSLNTLTFKKIINGYNVYIKLSLVNNQESYTLVLSFHKDGGVHGGM